MAGSFTVVPPQQTGLGAFVDAANPYLQMAFKQMLERKYADQQRQEAQQRLSQFAPDIFAPDYEQAAKETKQGGMTFAPGFTPKPEQWKDVYQARTGKATVPSKYMKFNIEKAKQYPGLDLSEVGIPYKVPQPQTPMFGLFSGQGGGQGGGPDQPPTNESEAKKRIIESGGNPSDYVYEPILSTAKGGLKVQTGVIPKLDTKLQENRIKGEERSRLIKEAANDTLNTISEVEKGISNFGLFGSIPSIPGTPRKTWETNVNKLLSGKIINLMTEMKEASKTGATGFGQLSNKELGVLKEASTALKRGLSPQDAQKILTDMKTKMQKIAGEEQGQAGVPQVGQSFNGERVMNVRRIE